jgi:guanylate kinase
MEGLDVFLEIEVQGAMKIKKNVSRRGAYFCVPPPLRFCREADQSGNRTPGSCGNAAKHGREEMRHAMEYDYVIINDNVEKAREELSCIVTAAKCQTKNMKKLIQKVSD